MDQHKAELNTSFFSNTTRSMFCYPHEPQLVWDFIHDTTFPWDFAAVTSITSPTAVLLNTCSHSGNSNTLLSSMAITVLLSRRFMCTVICFGWTVSFLSNTGWTLQFACWTLLPFGPQLLLRFVRFSIWQWLHGKGTWPLENGLTTKWWWLKAL